MNGRPERFQARCATEDIDGVLAYRLAGDLDPGAGEVLAFDKALGQALADFRGVVVDLGLVTFFGSSALNALLVLRRRAESLGMPVHLAAPSPPVVCALEITDATGLFRIHPDLDAALAQLTIPPPTAGPGRP